MSNLCRYQGWPNLLTGPWQNLKSLWLSQSWMKMITLPILSFTVGTSQKQANKVVPGLLGTVLSFWKKNATLFCFHSKNMQTFFFWNYPCHSIPACPCFQKARSDEMFVLLGFSTGTFVMQIEGKDNDQQGTINSQITYSIVSQEPEGAHMFWIDETTGKLYVKEPTLDREVRI